MKSARERCLLQLGLFQHGVGIADQLLQLLLQLFLPLRLFFCFGFAAVGLLGFFNTGNFFFQSGAAFFQLTDFFQQAGIEFLRLLCIRRKAR